MLRRAPGASRWIVLIAVLGTRVPAIALLIHEAFVVVDTAIDTLRDGTLSPKTAKALAVGMIEAVDVFPDHDRSALQQPDHFQSHRVGATGDRGNDRRRPAGARSLHYAGSSLIFARM